MRYRSPVRLALASYLAALPRLSCDISPTYRFLGCRLLGSVRPSGPKNRSH
ncbi:MAG: hypothetical protein QF692_03710 [Alphaproteobacteria bacterium]|nr:hypothetical protein [Alphaproteobacteria bacterium]MDP7222352.1 hypothetical protein [Alphaproteobacteria bacterium]